MQFIDNGKASLLDQKSGSTLGASDTDIKIEFLPSVCYKVLNSNNVLSYRKKWKN